jgi:hypothetical protein
MAVKDPEKDKLSTFPRRSLSGSISLALMLLDKVSRAGVDVKTAATALGYPTINGATKTTLAALRIYGLIDKPHGKDLVVPSETLIRLHTAGSEDEKREICRTLAMKPPLFSEMHQEGLNPDDRPLLIRWLLMQNYSERLAKRAANLYQENARYVGLVSSAAPFQLPLSAEIRPQKRPPPGLQEGAPPKAKDSVATYNFALGTCDATLTFSRGDFGEADLKSLRQYIDLLEQSWRVSHPEHEKPKV